MWKRRRKLRKMMTTSKIIALSFVLFCLITVVSIKLYSYKFLYNDYTITTLGQFVNLESYSVKNTNVIFVVSVNKSFLDFFENWFVHAKRVGLNKRDILVISEDSFTCDYITKKNILTFCPDKSQKEEALTYNSKGYINMVSMRPHYILKVLNTMKSDVFYFDLDTVMVRQHPLKLLESSKNVDMQIAIDKFDVTLDGYYYPEYYCTGVMFFKNNLNVKSFIQSWNQTLLNSPQLNQPAFNRILKKQPFISVTGFDTRKVLPGHLFNQRFKDTTNFAVVYHANFLKGRKKKKKFFVDKQLWEYI